MVGAEISFFQFSALASVPLEAHPGSKKIRVCQAARVCALGALAGALGVFRRQPHATQEAATPVKAFLSDALGWAAPFAQPVA